MIILTAILVLGILGFIFAGLLALAADYFRVKEDPRIAAIQAILPGINCGACGEPGCRAFAEKLAKGEVSVSGCFAGGVAVAEKLAQLMGAELVGDTHKKIAAVHCGAKENQRKKKALYAGVETCKAADLAGNAGMACVYGCMGYGDCVCVCPFDAIAMRDGLPVINAAKCTACGRCIVACPRKIISLIPADFQVVIACSSQDGGAITRKNCPVGCIACKICEKEAPTVFKIVDNLAVIDYNQEEIDCSSAISKCPTRCIVHFASGS
jgi:RnfABCDGE-type electron transport complex B subunit